MDDDFLTTSQARKAYGISNERMKQLLADGIIPFTTSPLDKRVKLIKRRDMEAWKQSVAWAPKPRRTKKEEQ